MLNKFYGLTHVSADIWAIPQLDRTVLATAHKNRAPVHNLELLRGIRNNPTKTYFFVEHFSTIFWNIFVSNTTH